MRMITCYNDVAITRHAPYVNRWIFFPTDWAGWLHFVGHLDNYPPPLLYTGRGQLVLTVVGSVLPSSLCRLVGLWSSCLSIQGVTEPSSPSFSKCHRMYTVQVAGRHPSLFSYKNTRQLAFSHDLRSRLSPEVKLLLSSHSVCCLKCRLIRFMPLTAKD